MILSEDAAPRMASQGRAAVVSGACKGLDGDAGPRSLEDVRRDIASLLNIVAHRNAESLQYVRRRAMHHQSAGEIRAWLADLQETVAIAESSVVAPALKWRGVESAVNEATLHHLFLKYEMQKAEPADLDSRPQKASVCATEPVRADAHTAAAAADTTSRDLFRPGVLIEVLLELKGETKDPNTVKTNKEWVLMKVIKVYRDGNENKFVKVGDSANQLFVCFLTLSILCLCHA
jgi:hypothetical protein